MSTESKAIFWGFFTGLFVAALLNTLPFADAELYRKAKQECEKTLPRNQHCTVVGVPVSVD